MASAVVDASVVVDLLLRRRSPEELALGDGTLSAPSHLDAEVLHALVRLARRGEIAAERGRTALLRLDRAPVERVGIADLTGEAWTLRENLSGYDALYVVLARRLDCPLITADRRLATAPGLGVPVVVV